MNESPFDGEDFFSKKKGKISFDFGYVREMTNKKGKANVEIIHANHGGKGMEIKISTPAQFEKDISWDVTMYCVVCGVVEE